MCGLRTLHESATTALSHSCPALLKSANRYTAGLVPHGSRGYCYATSMSGNDPKAAPPVWPQNLALHRVSDRIRLESSQCVAALSATAPCRNGSLPRDNSVRILLPPASIKSAQRAHRENRKAGTQGSLHSQRAFRSVFLLHFQFPKMNRTGNFWSILAGKSGREKQNGQRNADAKTEKGNLVPPFGCRGHPLEEARAVLVRSYRSFPPVSPE